MPLVIDNCVKIHNVANYLPEGIIAGPKRVVLPECILSEHRMSISPMLREMCEEAAKYSC